MLLTKLLVVLLLCIVGPWNLTEARSSRSRSSSRYSRYSYGSYASRTSSSYTRYTYRYSRSYTSYRASSHLHPYNLRLVLGGFVQLGQDYNYDYYSSSCSPCSSTSGSTLTSNTGHFNSHSGYGSVAYTNSMSCRWTILADAGKTVKLSFVSFATEKNYDQVKVYDGSDSTGTLLGTFHGTSSSDYSYPGSTVVYSTGRYMYVTFTSDSSVTKNGFSALYQHVSSGTAAPVTTTTMAAPVTTTPDSVGTTYCSGVQALTASSSYLIVSHSARSGLLLPSSTSGLGPYNSRMNCTWTVDGRSGKYLTFYLNYLNLETCYDKLRIYQSSVHSINLLRMYCDASTPVGAQAVIAIPIMGVGGAVTFITDGSVTRQGFILTFDYLDTYTSPSSTNNVCRNYAVNARGTAMGSFTCPNPFEPADFTQCCGSEDEQYCCKLQDNTPMLIGCIVGSVILVVIIIVVTICCCRTCRETQIKKSDNGSNNWRRSLNKAKAVTAWKRLGSSGGGSTTALIADNDAVSSGARASGSGGRSGSRYANIAALSAANSDSFTPPPVPPPSTLYYGANGTGGANGIGYGMQGHQFAPVNPTAAPPAYDTAYPPQAQSFRM
uniref:CUB domain-containing protein n=1 Tax=Macrostomum lignano TaxID=282301 RepID=A0A1I8J5J8_9PLAT